MLESPRRRKPPRSSMPDSAKEVTIRRARLSDAPSIAELSGQLGYPTPEKEMAGRLAHLIRHPRIGAVLMAETFEGKVVGWLHVSVTPLLEVPLRAEVNGLIVAEGQRGSGSGAKLLQAAEAWAKAKGCTTMSVRSNVVRDRAHSFYLRNGYEHYKTQKAFRKAL